MASQSNSVLTTFIIIAVLIFAAAVGWKMFGGEENTETTATETTEVAPEQKANTQKPVAATPQSNNNQAVVEPEPFLPITEEDKEARMEQARKSMKFAMRFKNAEDAIAALRRYKDNGNPELASSLLRYIQDTYPNTSIPADLVDL